MYHQYLQPKFFDDTFLAIPALVLSVVFRTYRLFVGSTATEDHGLWAPLVCWPNLQICFSNPNLFRVVGHEGLSDFCCGGTSSVFPKWSSPEPPKGWLKPYLDNGKKHQNLAIMWCLPSINWWFGFRNHPQYDKLEKKLVLCRWMAWPLMLCKSGDSKV